MTDTNREANGKWKKGVSPNPAGRPQGSRNKVSLAVDALLEGQAEKLTEKCIAMALSGDAQAMRIVMDRICPPKREAPAKIDRMPKVTDADSAIAALSRLIDAASTGEATPNEAAQLGGLVVNYLGISAIQAFAERLAALENAPKLINGGEKCQS